MKYIRLTLLITALFFQTFLFMPKSALAADVFCSKPSDYIVNPTVVIEPSNPKAGDNFKVRANFSFKNEFSACKNVIYFFKFYYDGYGGSTETALKEASFSGVTLSGGDTKSWSSLTRNITPSGSSINVTVGLYSVNDQKVPYEDTAVFKTQTVNVQGVGNTANNNNSGSGGNDSGSGSGSGSGAGPNGNQAAPTSGSGSGSGSGGSGSADVGKTFYNPLGSKTKDIPTFIISVIKTILGITGALAVLFIIIGGLRYIISAGNETSAKEAKNTITYAIIGLIFAVMSFAIVTVITNLLINK